MLRDYWDRTDREVLPAHGRPRRLACVPQEGFRSLRATMKSCLIGSEVEEIFVSSYALKSLGIIYLEEENRDIPSLDEFRILSALFIR